MAENEECIGKGTITKAQLNSVNEFKQRMTREENDQKILDFIIKVSYPKGHPEKRTKTQAIKEIFEGENQMTIVSRAFNMLTNNNKYHGMLCELFFGEEARNLEKKEIEEVKPKKRELTNIEKVEKERKITIKKLNQKFRKEHNLKVRGRMPKPLINKYDLFIKEHIDKDINMITAIKENKNSDTIAPMKDAKMELV